MIPDHDPEPRPPITLSFVLTLALLAPLSQLLWMILFDRLGLRLFLSSMGMAALVTYGGLFALCAARFRLPPARQLAFAPAPLSAWLAVGFLVATVIVSSELDNFVKSLVPPPAPVPSEPASSAPPLLGAALILLYVGVFPLTYNVFFRGVLQPLATARAGVIPGVLLTAFFSSFASVFPWSTYVGWWPLAPAVLNGLILCILRQSSGSLWPVLALDSLWGVVQVCAEYRVFGLVGFDGGGTHTPWSWVAGCALLTVVGLVLCRAAARAGSTRPSTPAQG